MKWYTSEPVKNIPILVKANYREITDPRHQIFYMVVEGNDSNEYFPIGGSNECLWKAEDFLCWTPYTEIEADIFNSNLE